MAKAGFPAGWLPQESRFAWTPYVANRLPLERGVGTHGQIGDDQHVASDRNGVQHLSKHVRRERGRGQVRDAARRRDAEGSLDPVCGIAVEQAQYDGQILSNCAADQRRLKVGGIVGRDREQRPAGWQRGGQQRLLRLASPIRSGMRRSRASPSTAPMG